ncbi:unnamed protein product [Dibothriocephalus latus]|uniref:Uncharacterized protein n=1 Tax=Dibothriocephalus latus TaxID=60516 RepID=A0A3P7NLL5_DIBLA|nr:unnamed protein product [Dibothriocephalus latus]
MVLILGMEGSANKLGVGVSHVVQLVKRALDEAKVTPEELDAIAYTKVGNLCQRICVFFILPPNPEEGTPVWKHCFTPNKFEQSKGHEAGRF